MSQTSPPFGAATDTFDVRVLRQDRPIGASYWQTFRLAHEPGMNLTSVLQRIAAEPRTLNGELVAPIAYDANCLEEVCGSCTMLINGRVRQACSAHVDRILYDRSQQIELRPLTKFPVIRDLVVDRRRLFRALEKVRGWIPVDGYYDIGPGPRQSPQEQQRAYPLIAAQPTLWCLLLATAVQRRVSSESSTCSFVPTRARYGAPAERIRTFASVARLPND